MKPIKHILPYAMFAVTIMAVAPSAPAQQINGTPGSPEATTTVDGSYLPPPPSKFGGVINMDVKNSKPYWPPTVVPPKGAPNVLLIMTDDQGYGVSGTFGGVIPTPNLDRIAKMGLRYTCVQLDLALLAYAGSPHHRSQPPLGRLRSHRRAGHRLPGLQLHHRRR